MCCIEVFACGVWGAGGALRNAALPRPPLGAFMALEALLRLRLLPANTVAGGECGPAAPGC